MAGGIFDRSFQLNVKCIVFSLIIMVLFLYNPNIENNIIMGATLFTIFVIAYVSMAWYDYFYNCDILPLKRGNKSFTGLFKPQQHSKKQTEKDKSHDNKKGHMIIYLSHILFIVPLLLYIAYYQKKVNKITYPILIVLGIFTLLYHGGAMIYGSHNN